MKKIRIALLIFVFLILVVSFFYFRPENKKEIKTEHFHFLFSSNINSATITELANALESNYSRIGNDLETKPPDGIEVDVYAERWHYIKATGNWSASGSIEGISKLHFVKQAWSESNNKKVAVHEFAHAVTLKLLLDNEGQPVDSKKFDQKFSAFPTWLWEGVSVYEAQQFVDPRTLPYLNNGQYPNIAELNSRLKGGKIYSCGYTIIEFILEKYGRDKLIELIKNYGDLKTTLGVTADQFCKDWYEFVKEKYLQ
jgi:hypothetical protein